MARSRSFDQPDPGPTLTSDASTAMPAAAMPGDRGGTRPEPKVVALTVLHHPDARRVGERVLLGELRHGREMRLSRTEPRFSSALGGPAQPLRVSYLSRKPLVFGVDSEGVFLDSRGTGTRVSVNGEPVVGKRHLAPSELENGAVLELAQSVVLCLHLHEASVKRPPNHGLVGESAGMIRLRAEIGRVADLEIPVLLLGETGTGKELVASAIHRASGRRGRFIAVNLAAVPDALAASELFGAAKGAFTGAEQRRPGYFEQAEGGTLFLDEIGEASIDIQVLLLRALESGEIQPVGAESPRRVDVRVVAATDADLDGAIEAGRFRAPLRHRLAGYELYLPALRDRRDDFGLLFQHFLNQELSRLGEKDGLERPDLGEWLPASVTARLAGIDWPGNVRQLKNVARQLVVSSRGSASLKMGIGVERLLEGSSPPEARRPAARGSRSSRRRRLSSFSEAELVNALERSAWDIKAAAANLGVSRSSLYSLMDRSPGFRVPSQIPDREILLCREESGGDLQKMVERLKMSRRALKRRLGRLEP